MSSDSSFVQHPSIKLEDVRENFEANQATGRGGETASSRGYNAERLAGAVLSERCSFHSWSDQSHYDTFVTPTDGVCGRVECKSCIYRYPSGGYGRFRIWEHHHGVLSHMAENWSDTASYLYFFVVYTVEDTIEREVGKLVTTAGTVDDVIDEWTLRNHDSMGEKRARDISWRVLLRRLGVSQEQFETADIIDLTT